MEPFLQQLQEEFRRQTQELKKSRERYRLLASLGRIVSSTLDLRKVFQRAAGKIHKAFGSDRVSLVQVQGERCHGFALEFGPSARWVGIPAIPVAGSAAEWVMQQRKPRTVRRLDQSRSLTEDHTLFEQGFRAYSYLPLLCRHQAVGILGLAAREDARLDDWDFRLLGELGGILATALDNAAAYSQIAQLKAQLERENIYLRDEIKTEHDITHLVGESRALREVRQAIEQVAGTDSTVMIVGETGTGKELVARAVHELSPRKDHLLVKVNCAALAPGILQSELFGHEPGAFTGAVKRRLGRFELAHAGSILLDEIAEVPPDTQVLLLRVLQERVIERVGGNEPIPVDVRVIAATNRDLHAAVHDGSFRSDLFYRLNVFPIRVPSLRERREDVPHLVGHFIGHFNRRMNRRVRGAVAGTMELLQGYHWPGNVRELENLIERAMIVATGDVLEIDPTWLSGPAAPASSVLAHRERQAILEALERTGGKVYGPDGAAAILGVKPTTLYGKMRKHQIRKEPGTLHFR